MAETTVIWIHKQQPVYTAAPYPLRHTALPPPPFMRRPLPPSAASWRCGELPSLLHPRAPVRTFRSSIPRRVWCSR